MDRSPFVRKIGANATQQRKELAAGRVDAALEPTSVSSSPAREPTSVSSSHQSAQGRAQPAAPVRAAALDDLGAAAAAPAAAVCVHAAIGVRVRSVVPL